MKPYAFVIPWYGEDIRGGAESECYQLVHLFHENGIPVEVFTTCVKQASDDRGRNTMQEGVFEESGITVRRFPVKPQNMDRLVPVHLKLFQGEYVTEREEKVYFEEDINSPKMYKYIRKHRNEYEYFIFIPYLYAPTYFGSMECPDNAVIIPCFHDEPYAHMALMKERMSRFKKMIFLSKPESDLAHDLYDLSGVQTAVLGAYVESGWENELHPERFRHKFGIEDRFLLFAGRKDAGKKADMLLEYYSRYRMLHPECGLKLVFIGGGELHIPEHFKNDVFDLGFVSLEDKHDAFAAAYVLCNPSFFESFSIVIMESWLAKRPVLVSEQCKVTTNFCKENNGGLWFDSYPVFEGCLDYMMDHPEEMNRMGENGYGYVQENFVREAIYQKYNSFLKA